jgi:hypothetical protein
MCFGNRHRSDSPRTVGEPPWCALPLSGTLQQEIKNRRRIMTKELDELIEIAKKIKMTPEQQTEQRRSFAYGNTHIENDRITRELIADIDRKLHQSK